MPVNWTADLNVKFLLACIESLGAGSPKWPEVLDKMGPEFTDRSVGQQWSKLKKQAAELSSAPDAASASPSATPRKRKPAAAKPAAADDGSPAKKRGRAAKKLASGGDENGDVGEKADGKAEVKEEGEGGADGDGDGRVLI